VRFEFDRLEVNPRFAAISRPSNACVLVRLRVDMEDRGGKLVDALFFNIIDDSLVIAFG
jgi:flagellar motor switch protein FliM